MLQQRLNLLLTEVAMFFGKLLGTQVAGRQEVVLCVLLPTTLCGGDRMW